MAEIFNLALGSKEERKVKPEHALEEVRQESSERVNIRSERYREVLIGWVLYLQILSPCRVGAAT